MPREIGSKLDLSFSAPPDLSFDKIVETQSSLLQMAELVKEALEAASIDYYLFAGSLAGAHFYHGWIPWDVDFDLAIFDDEYDRALEVLRNALPNQYIVHNSDNDPIYCASWARVKDLSTRVVYRNKHNLDNYFSRFHSISLDLYRLRRGSLNEARQTLSEEVQTFFAKKMNLGMIDESEYVYRVDSALEKINKKYFLENYGDNEETVFDPVKLKYLCSYKNFSPGTVLKFSGVNFASPNNPEKVLKSLYGDNFRKVPVFDDRLTSFLKVISNLPEKYWESNIVK